MDIAKKIVKRLIGIENPKQILPLQSLTYIGAGAWGYWVPSNFLNKHSVCYCVGAGEDISFDTQLKTKYDCAIYIFDPTPASKKHFDEVVKAGLSNEPLPFPPLNPEYRYAISYNKLKEMHFIEEGVWSHKDVLKFYDADQDNYVSHSVVLFKDSGKTMELPVNSIKNFMTQFGHRSIDLLKLEIEGAEPYRKQDGTDDGMAGLLADGDGEDGPERQQRAAHEASNQRIARRHLELRRASVDHLTNELGGRQIRHGSPLSGRVIRRRGDACLRVRRPMFRQEVWPMCGL